MKKALIITAHDKLTEALQPAAPDKVVRALRKYLRSQTSFERTKLIQNGWLILRYAFANATRKSPVCVSHCLSRSGQAEITISITTPLVSPDSGHGFIRLPHKTRELTITAQEMTDVVVVSRFLTALDDEFIPNARFLLMFIALRKAISARLRTCGAEVGILVAEDYATYVAANDRLMQLLSTGDSSYGEVERSRVAVDSCLDRILTGIADAFGVPAEYVRFFQRDVLKELAA